MKAQRKVYFIAQEHDTGDECTHKHATQLDASMCAQRRMLRTASNDTGIPTTQWHVVKVTQSS